MPIIKLHSAVALVDSNGDMERSVINGENGVGGVRKLRTRSSSIHINRRVIVVLSAERIGMERRGKGNGVRIVRGGRGLLKIDGETDEEEVDTIEEEDEDEESSDEEST